MNKLEPVAVERQIITRTATIVRTIVAGKYIFIESREVKQVSSKQ